MNHRRLVSRRRLVGLALTGLLAIACQACAPGDLGRQQPGYLQDTVLPALRAVASDIRGVAVSSYPLTGDEAELRARSHSIVSAQRGWSADRAYASAAESVGLADSTYQRRRRLVHSTGRTAYDAGPWSRRRDVLALVVSSETGEFEAFGHCASRVYRSDAIRRTALVHGAELSDADIRDTAGRIRANRRIVEQTILAMWNRIDDYRLELRRSVVEHPGASGRAAAAIETMAATVAGIESRLRPRAFPEQRRAGPRLPPPRHRDSDLMGG